MSRMAVSQEEWRKRANVGRGGGWRSLRRGAEQGPVPKWPVNIYTRLRGTIAMLKTYKRSEQTTNINEVQYDSSKNEKSLVSQYSYDNRPKFCESFEKR